MKERSIFYGLMLFAVAGVYLIAAKFGLSLAFFISQVTTIWPASGIAIVALPLFGEDLWPGIFLGAFVINLITHEPFVAALFIGVGNTLEAVVCVRLLRKFGFENTLDHVRDVIAFIVFSFLACGIAAVIGTATLIVSGLATWEHVFRVVSLWWIGDAMGAFLVVPFLLAWSIPSARKRFLENASESIIALASAFVATTIIFFIPVIGLSAVIKILVLPFFIWAAFRLGSATVATMGLGVAMIATYATLRGMGPFVGSAPIEVNIMYSYLFVYITVAMALLSSAGIEERNAATRSIVFGEKRLRSLMEHSADGIVLLDREGKILYATIPTKSILGFNEQEIKERNIFSMIHFNDQTPVRVKFTWLIAHPGKPATLELQARHKKGFWVWLEVVATNLLDEPSVRAIVVNYHDITGRRRSEDQIQAYTQELERAATHAAEEMAKEEALLSSIGDGFIATDKEGNVIFINPAAEKMLDWSVKDVIGKSLFELLEVIDEDGKALTREERPLQLALSTGKPVSTNIGMNYYYARPDGRKFPVAITATPVILNDVIIGAEEVFKDVTKEQQIDRAKSEFVSLTSHQLRTPLSIVNWYTEALLKGKLGTFNKKQNQYLKQIYTANQRLVNTVNNLLNVSRLEMGTFPIDPVPLDIKRIAMAAVTSLSRQIRAKNLVVIKEFDKKLPTVVLDKSLTAAIFDNLISNAVKYTGDKGRIRIGLSHAARTFTIVVEDNGYGIPKEEQGKIFDRFYRGTNVVEKNTDGNGLGLYIVKRMVEFMGGRIGFFSEENKGTKFSVTIPVEGTRGAHTVAVRGQVRQRVKVL